MGRQVQQIPTELEGIRNIDAFNALLLPSRMNQTYDNLEVRILTFIHQIMTQLLPHIFERILN